MKIRKFTAKNLQAAMMKVYNALGEDALIYSTNTTAKGIEIRASAATEEVAPGETNVMMESKVQQMPVLDAGMPVTARADTQMVDTLNSQIQGLQDKVKKLSDFIENKLLFQFYSADSESLVMKNMLFYHLGKLGFRGAFSHQFIADYVLSHHITDQVTEADIETALLSYIKTEKNEFIDESGVFALVGPTGVGKTTTIAKLASRYAARYGAESVGIITTDHHDIFNKNQLLNFSDMFSIDLEYANSTREFATTLRNMQHKRIILVDTYGVTQRDADKVKKLMDMLEKQKVKISTYLTLPCNMQEASLEEVAEAFSGVNLRGCILTKQDEASSLHSALSVCMKHHLNIAYLCYGQDVKRDIAALKADEILELLKTNKIPSKVHPLPVKKSFFQKLGRKKAS